MTPVMAQTYEEARRSILRLRQRSVPIGETIIERDCRDKGYEIFMPSYWMEAKHHRTKQWMDKRFPMLTGYAFVNLPEQQFEKLRSEVDSVLCVLKPGKMQQPFEFTEWAVGAMRLAEWREEQSFKYDKARRLREEEVAAMHLSRKQINDMFPSGRHVKISDQSRFCAGLKGRVIGASSQGTIKTVIEALNSSFVVDVPIEYITEVA